MKAAQVVLARLDDVEEAMGGLSMRCRQYDNVLKMVGELQQQVERLEGERNSKVETLAELRQQQQQTEAAHQKQQHALQQEVERLEGWRKMHFDTIQHQQQTIISKEQEVQALKDELATVQKLLNEG